MTAKRLSREESRQQTKEKLLEAAIKVFSTRGFYAATVDEVAEEAGFSKGAVYSNFSSKAELFLALLDRRVKLEMERWDKILQQYQGVNSGVPAFEQHLEQERSWNMLTLEFFLYAMRDEKAREKLAEIYRTARTAMQKFLGNETNSGSIKPLLPPEQLTWLLTGMGTGLAVQYYIEPEITPSYLYEEIMGRLLNLKNSPPESSTPPGEELKGSGE